MIRYVWFDYNFDYVRFGSDVRKAREIAGLTQGQLADLTGHFENGQSLSAIEHGKVKLTVTSLLSLCNALDLDPRDYVTLF